MNALSLDDIGELEDTKIVKTVIFGGKAAQDEWEKSKQYWEDWYGVKQICP